MESPSPNQTENRPLPQIDVLQCVNRNLFPDVALQTIGLRILGSVFEKHPELNKPELYERVDEFDQKFKTNWNEFKIQARYVGAISFHMLLTSYDSMVNEVAGFVRHIASEPVVKIVGGTLRLHVGIRHYHCEDDVTVVFTLMWIEKQQ